MKSFHCRISTVRIFFVVLEKEFIVSVLHFCSLKIISQGVWLQQLFSHIRGPVAALAPENMVKTSRENERERRKQEAERARQIAGKLQTSPDMLLPAGVMIRVALGNVFDHKVRSYPHKNFSSTPKYSSLHFFSLISLSLLLPSPLYHPWLFSFTTRSSMLARDALRLAFQAQILPNLQGNLVLRKSVVYSSILTNTSTSPQRDGMFSCQ